MKRVFTSDLSHTRIRSILRATQFGDRTRCPGAATRESTGVWTTAAAGAHGAATGGTPLARESFEAPEILELLYLFELRLTDHAIAERVDVSYDRVHRFYLKLRRAILDFEERSFRLLDGEVGVDETYFGASFDNRRARKRAKLRKAGKVRRGRAAKELQQPVFGINERADGIIYVNLVLDNTSGAELKAVLRENVSIETTISSDEYVRGSASINGIEMK